MTTSITAIILSIFGVIFGSFVNALVWRIWQQEQLVLKKNKLNASEKRRYSILHGRSMCPNCQHQLAATDMIPVFSWLWLRGRCRYCSKPIPWQYPLVELVTGTLFLVSFIYWPWQLTAASQAGLFAIWLVIITIGVALAVYDLRWMILPNRLVYALLVVSGVFMVAAGFISGSLGDQLFTSVLGSAVFGGFFYLLHAVSSGRWIGGGDVRLGFVLGLLLGWQKALLCITLASYLGTLVVLFLVVSGKYHKKMKLPFGPFLLTSAFVVMLWGQVIVDWYLRLSGL